jgi:hypothetical protein
MAGAVTFAAIADWAADLDTAARHRLGFTGPIPAGTTVWRFLIRLDAALLQAVLSGWLRARPAIAPGPNTPPPGRTIIAVDGKVMRGARLPEGRQVHLLSAYDTTTGIVLAQSTISTKSNEIPAFIPLLDQVQAMLGSLQGVVIVADALLGADHFQEPIEALTRALQHADQATDRHTDAEEVGEGFAGTFQRQVLVADQVRADRPDPRPVLRRCAGTGQNLGHGHRPTRTTTVLQPMLDHPGPPPAAGRRPAGPRPTSPATAATTARNRHTHAADAPAPRADRQPAAT